MQGGGWGGNLLASYIGPHLPLLSLSILDSPFSRCVLLNNTSFLFSLLFFFSRAVGLNYLLQTGLALLLKRLLRLSGHLSHSAREYLGGVMVLPCLLALLVLPTPALALAAFLASLLPAALLGTSLGQQVDLVLFVPARQQSTFPSLFSSSSF